MGVKRTPTRTLVTGLSYIFSVVMLALPYFLARSMLLAFTASLSLAVTLIAAFTHYSVVVQGKSFTREFTETTLLMLGTAFWKHPLRPASRGIFGIEHI